MITENNPVPPGANGPFRPHQIPRASDLNNLVDGINRSGKLLGGGRAFSGGGPNPTLFVPTPPAITRGFWARTTSPFSIGQKNYSDERYYIFRLRTTGDIGQTDQLKREDDEPPENSDGDLNEPWPLTATNRAEIKDHTHLLPDDTEVWVMTEQDTQGGNHYVFYAGVGGEQSYPAKIEAWCDSKGGTYKVSVYVGPTTMTAALCTAGTLAALALPEGMPEQSTWVDESTGVPVSLQMLAVHTKEDGLKTHWLKIGSWTVGSIRMSTNGLPVFFISDGYARSIGGPLLESGNLDLNSDPSPESWIRDFIDNQAGDANQKGDSPVQIVALTRAAHFAGSGQCDPNSPGSLPRLEIGMRTLQLDAQGHVAGLGAELAPLDIYGCCPPQTSLASASFTTDSQAAASRALVSMTISANQ